MANECTRRKREVSSMAGQTLCFLYNILLFIVLPRYDILFNKVMQSTIRKDINFTLFIDLLIEIRLMEVDYDDI